MAATLQRHLFTVADYHRLGEAGVLGEDDRVELIDGDIVEMSPIGSSHAGLVIRLTRWFVEHAGDRGVVSVQNPLRIGDRCEPQPDLLLLKPRPDDYADDHPRPADVLLLVEVADSSWQTDRSVKLPMYASAGIAEVWLVDVAGAAIEVHTQPTADGYAHTERFAGAQHLPIAALAGIEASVDALIGADRR